MAKSSVWTREQIDVATTAGDLIIIYKGWVYNLTRWAPHHPGGDLVLQHLNGRSDPEKQRVCVLVTVCSLHISLWSKTYQLRI